jgi:hypothetical protein
MNSVGTEKFTKSEVGVDARPGYIFHMYDVKVNTNLSYDMMELHRKLIKKCL